MPSAAPVPLTRLARDGQAKPYFFLGAEHRLFEGEVEHGFGVGAAHRSAASAAATEPSAEERLEDVADSAAEEVASVRAAAATNTSGAEHVVALPLLGIRERLVGDR